MKNLILCLFGLLLLAVPTLAVGATEDWSRVKLEKRDHAPLLARQAKNPASLARDPVVAAVLVLQADLAGKITEVSASYDRMENPAEAKVTVTEGGILKDDLIAVRHLLELARNSNNEWHVIGYHRGELRREYTR